MYITLNAHINIYDLKNQENSINKFKFKQYDTNIFAKFILRNPVMRAYY